METLIAILSGVSALSTTFLLFILQNVHKSLAICVEDTKQCNLSIAQLAANLARTDERVSNLYLLTQTAREVRRAGD